MAQVIINIIIVPFDHIQHWLLLLLLLQGWYNIHHILISTTIMLVITILLILLLHSFTNSLNILGRELLN